MKSNRNDVQLWIVEYMHTTRSAVKLVVIRDEKV